MEMQDLVGFYDLLVKGFMFLGASAVVFVLVDAINFGQITSVNQED